MGKWPLACVLVVLGGWWASFFSRFPFKPPGPQVYILVLMYIGCYM
jgi:hypothetical protein